VQVPQRLPGAPRNLRLLDGPERIETGWWDGREVSRDYYVALDPEGARVWVFRERLPPHEWFLHGVFG
jgi:protein ImuB